jgi:hypothetical protein
VKRIPPPHIGREAVTLKVRAGLNLPSKQSHVLLFLFRRRRDPPDGRGSNDSWTDVPSIAAARPHLHRSIENSGGQVLRQINFSIASAWRICVPEANGPAKYLPHSAAIKEAPSGFGLQSRA